MSRPLGNATRWWEGDESSPRGGKNDNRGKENVCPEVVSEGLGVQEKKRDQGAKKSVSRRVVAPGGPGVRELKKGP